MLNTYPFLIPRFLEAMNDVARHGYEKYGEDSFQHRALMGNTDRHLERTQSIEICKHACTHLGDYLSGKPHDHFQTKRHQLAAVAINAMMEFYFAGLKDEA